MTIAKVCRAIDMVMIVLCALSAIATGISAWAVIELGRAAWEFVLYVAASIIYAYTMTQYIKAV